MSLKGRVDRMEAASSPAQVIRIDAVDEADYSRQFEDMLFHRIKHAPCLVELEVHMNGEVKRERMNILTFEEYLELLD